MYLLLLITIFTVVVFYFIKFKNSSTPETPQKTSNLPETQPEEPNLPETQPEEPNLQPDISESLSKCTSSISIKNGCEDTVKSIIIPVLNEKLNLEPDTICLDFTGMYPGVPPEVVDYTIYDRPNKGDYLLYNTTDSIPNYLELMQGGIGDCCIDSILAVLAKNQPDIIKNMIYTENGSIYYLKFYYDGKNVLIKINDELPLDYLLDGVFDVFYKDPKGGKPLLWPHLILKGIACIINYTDMVIDDTIQGYNRLSYGFNSNEAINLFYLLTGSTDIKLTNSFDFSNLSDNKFLCISASGKKLENSSDSVNTFETVDGVYIIYDKNKNIINCIPQLHCFSLMSFDNNILTLRNPWGTYSLIKGYTYKDGLFTISLQDFNILFNGFGSNVIYCKV